MDDIELRNLLLHHRLDDAVLAPLGYNSRTFKLICKVVEEAMDFELFYCQRKSAANAKLVNAVKQLRKMKAGRSDSESETEVASDDE